MHFPETMQKVSTKPHETLNCRVFFSLSCAPAIQPVHVPSGRMMKIANIHLLRPIDRTPSITIEKLAVPSRKRPPCSVRGENDQTYQYLISRMLVRWMIIIKLWLLDTRCRVLSKNTIRSKITNCLSLCAWGRSGPRRTEWHRIHRGRVRGLRGCVLRLRCCDIDIEM